MSSLESALQILLCFDSRSPDLGVGEVAVRTGMPKSSVSRLMKSMGESGLLQQDDARRTYSPGVLAFQLGNLYQRHLKVLDLVDQALKELVDETGLTGYVSVLNRSDIVIIQVRQGSHPVRLVLEKGYRIPAFVTAVGLALLARETDAAILAMHSSTRRYEETGLARKPAEVLADVKRARKRQFAQVVGTTFSGFTAIGVAVESPAENECLGFSLSFPNRALSKAERDEMASRLLEKARWIGARVDDPYWVEALAPDRRSHLNGVRASVPLSRALPV